jgi:hypothetical protein
MGNSSGTGSADLKPEDARAGGEDDARIADRPGGAGASPENTRAGGEDDARGTGGIGGASSEERENIPRGAPDDSRSAAR